MPEKRHKGESAAQHAAHSNPRVKDVNQEHNDITHGLSDNTKSFYTELSTLFPELRVTSGKRDTSPSGNFSHHHNGDALDIGPEHTDVYEYLNNTPEGLDLMNRHGLGILDETDPRNMKKTSATGAHFHIGKDSGLYANTKARYDQVDNIQPMYSFGAKNPTFDYSDLDNLDNADLQLTGQHVPVEEKVEISPDMVGADERLGAKFSVVVPNKQVANTFIKEVKTEQDKVEMKADKLNKSSARQNLLNQEMEEKAKIDKIFQTMGAVRQRDVESQTRVKPKTNQTFTPTPQIDIQQGLPTLPSLFKS